MKMIPLWLADFYKFGHVSQYAKGTRQIWTNWTPRGSRVEGTTHIVNFGLNYLIKEYLLDQFQEQFFNRPLPEILSEYRDICKQCLFIDNPPTEHIEKLHAEGRLPIRIYALPEGAHVPLRVPVLVMTNTVDHAFWVPNYLETLLSSALWRASTSATTAYRYRQIFEKYAKQAGETDLSFITWQGHDFSMRGMGIEDCMTSGMGHLTQFSGTDTVPAILAAREYYHADLSVGGSVPATEHSVMCAGGKDGEFETFKRLITEVYPTGIVSIVSDTWDLWQVLTDYIPRLKEIILNRQGKLVIRPDSGDPVKIICGDPDATGPAQKGVLKLLAEALGTTNGMINGAGAIYGDSITPERAEAILSQTIDKLGLSPYNMVFGIGSFTYQYVTRDTYGWAMKATAVRDASGDIIPIFKKPVTDNGEKFSAKGILAVYKTNIGFELLEDADEKSLANCAFDLVFEDGALLVDPTFDEIRERARNGVRYGNN